MKTRGNYKILATPDKPSLIALLNIDKSIKLQTDYIVDIDGTILNIYALDNKNLIKKLKRLTKNKNLINQNSNCNN